MNILVYGMLPFLVALFLHILIWKVWVPRKQAQALLLIFFSILAVIFVILPRILTLTVAEHIHTILFFTSLVLAYIVTYSAIAVDSPSLLIEVKISNTKSAGMKEEDLRKVLTDELLVKPRIKDLLNEDMVIMDGDKYKLTEKGRLIIGIFIFYRKLLGCKKGG